MKSPDDECESTGEADRKAELEQVLSSYQYVIACCESYNAFSENDEV